MTFIFNKSEYQDHQLFTELAYSMKFYKRLSLHVFRWVPQGTHSIFNFDSYVLSSLGETVESIELVVKNGRINDGWALLRKYYDSVILNVYVNLYLNNEFSADNFIVHQINNWIKGKSKSFRFNKMLEYILENKELRCFHDIAIGDNEKYIDIRNRCNNHVHYNTYLCMLINNNDVKLNN